MFSKSCQYALRAVIHIAHKSSMDERVGIKDIAKAINSPEAFTGKIMQQLSKSGIIQSIKGPSGGFWVEKDSLKDLSVVDIVKAIDGTKLYDQCILGLPDCNDAKPCPFHHEYTIARQQISALHNSAKIEDLAQQLEGSATLK